MSPLNGFAIKERYAGAIRWSLRSPCGEDGCARHPQCRCAFTECDKPIEEAIPYQIFRTVGRKVYLAQFHDECFLKVVHLRVGCAKEGATT